MPNSELVQSVLKALDLFRLIAGAGRPLRLADVAYLSGEKPTTVHNLLRTLRARGFVMQDEEGAYLAGPALEELHREIRNRHILRLAGGLLREMAHDYPQIVFTFSELTASAIVCRLRMSPDRPGELQHPAEQVFPAYSAVTSRCLQALAVNAGIFEAVFPFEEYGAARYRSYDDFLAEREMIRKQGYCAGDNGGTRQSLALFVPENYALGMSSDLRRKLPLADAQVRLKCFLQELT